MATAKKPAAKKPAAKKAASTTAAKTKAKTPVKAKAATKAPAKKPAAKAPTKAAAKAKAAPKKTAPKASGKAAEKETVRKSALGFRINEHIVYPAHGVGQITEIVTQEIAGMSLDLFVVKFDKEKMVLRVPLDKAKDIGMRKLADDTVMGGAIKTLKGRARV